MNTMLIAIALITELWELSLVSAHDAWNSEAKLGGGRLHRDGCLLGTLRYVCTLIMSSQEEGLVKHGVQRLFFLLCLLLGRHAQLRKQL